MADEENNPHRVAEPLAYRPARRRRRVTRPAMLLIVGIYLCIGCIPIPSTQQYMVNGNKRPGYLIGSGDKNPIRLNQTTITTAIDILSEHVAGKQYDANFLSGASTRDAQAVRREQVARRPDGRVWAVAYHRRSGYLVWPICGWVQTLDDVDYLLLDVNDQGVVTGYRTTREPHRYGFEFYRDFGHDPTTRPSTQPTSTGP